MHTKHFRFVNRLELGTSITAMPYSLPFGNYETLDNRLVYYLKENYICNYAAILGRCQPMVKFKSFPYTLSVMEEHNGNDSEVSVL